MCEIILFCHVRANNFNQRRSISIVLTFYDFSIANTLNTYAVTIGLFARMCFFFEIFEACP